MKRLLLLFIFASGVIYAQSDSINKLDEIVLRGNFSPVINSGYKVQVMTDSIFGNSYESLGDLLQKQANFYFKQNGNGMVSSISLRGTSASQTGVYWNGIGINSSLNGQTDFNTLQANSFDRLEIRKGGGSVLFGNGAVGGAINLKDELNFNTGQQARVLIGLSSYDSYFTQLTGIWGSDRFYAKISAGAQASENDYPYLETNLKNDNGAYANYNLNATLGFKINELHSLRFNTSIFDNDRELSRTLSSESKAKLKNNDQRFLLDWTYLGSRFTSSAKIAILREKFQYLFDKYEPANESIGSSDRFIGKYDVTYFLNNDLFFRAGLEFENAKGDGGNIDKASREDFTGYALMHHEPWEKFMYNVSIRAGASSAYTIPIIYSLDVRYLLTSSLSMRGAYSTNYRLPTFNDLYWEPGGNPELNPEFSSSGEIGLDYQLKKINISAGWYMIKSEDLIQWRPITQDFWSPVNVDNATNHGLEFTASYRHLVGKNLILLKASYDYTLATDDDSDKQLIYVPKHRAGGILGYSWKKWNFNYNLQYTGKVFVTTSNTENLDDYLLSDISLGRSLYKDIIDLNFKANNLFDVNYQSVAFRPMPGRNYVFQINFKL